MKNARSSNRDRSLSWLAKARTWYGLRLLVGLVGAVLAGHSEELSLTEYQVKARCLYSFTKFVEWPAEAFADKTSPYLIGVLGEDPFGSVLEQEVAGRTVNGRAFEVKRFKRVEDMKPCHILFISTAEKKHLAAIFQRVKKEPVLTVGETDQFAKQGGGINFVLEDERLAMEVNVAAAEQSGLKISSQFLSMKKVKRIE